MNPQYKVRIVVTLAHPVADKSIELRQERYLPFVPTEGQTVRITSEDESEQCDLTFHAVVYDTAAHMFICDIQDDQLIETYSESGACNGNDLVQEYVAFGFQRITYPTAQAVRNVA